MERLDSYFQAIDMIENQELLVTLRSNDWPNLKPQQRKKLHRYIYKKAYPNDKGKSLTLEDMAKIRGFGHG